MATDNFKGEKLSHNSNDNDSSFLMTGIAWQESLLQAYRNYMVVTQSIFIAVSIVLFDSQVSATTLNGKSTFAIPLFVIALIGISTLRILSIAIIERAKSVDWWQRRLLKYENSHSIHRHFITFRTAKEHSFNLPEMKAETLTQEDIDTLLRPNIPKARKVFGFFIPGFYFLWFILILSSIINFPWRELLAFLKT